ncbi:ycf20-like protein isoform X2 [Actinidia eriantha]|uniref:ycf20-like protein isoform X2 n=2 Tax=Actinidia eriantha TaxID=165200 RepID=UPI00258291AD|nr:ycf20-like protein isoform X2 [Actinidia eriantha]
MKHMTYGKGTIMLQLSLPLVEHENSKRLSVVHKSCHSMLNRDSIPSIKRQTSKFAMKSAAFPGKSSHSKRHYWKISFALDTGGISNNGGQEAQDDDTQGLGRTRLGRIASAGGRQLLEKLNAARKNFPMKVFLVLLGFYTANALATILGQTGDWDVLVAGVVVAAIEGIGMLMYRKSSSLTTGRLQSLVAMINYWKAGVCLGLFVDAFKLGS